MTVVKVCSEQCIQVKWHSEIFTVNWIQHDSEYKRRIHNYSDYTIAQNLELLGAPGRIICIIQHWFYLRRNIGSRKLWLFNNIYYLVECNYPRSKVILVKKPVPFLFLYTTLSISLMGGHYFCFFVFVFLILILEYTNTKMVLAECFPWNFWNITPEKMHIKCFIITSNCPFGQKRFTSHSKDKFKLTFKSIQFSCKHHNL